MDQTDTEVATWRAEAVDGWDWRPRGAVGFCMTERRCGSKDCMFVGCSVKHVTGSRVAMVDHRRRLNSYNEMEKKEVGEEKHMSVAKNG